MRDRRFLLRIRYHCKKNKSLALSSSGQHLLIDSYTTFAVTIGIGLVIYTGYKSIDAIIAIVMGIWIIYNGYKIIRESLAGIMDEADIALLEEVITEINKDRNKHWIDLHNLRVIKYGALMHIDCHLTVPWYFNVNEAHAVVDEFTRIIKNKFGDSVEFFVHTDGCMPFSCPICTIENCAERKSVFEKKLNFINSGGRFFDKSLWQQAVGVHRNDICKTRNNF